MMDNDFRLDAFYAAQELRELLSMWNGTSHDVKIATVKDALKVLERIPLPDDLAEEGPVLSVTDEALAEATREHIREILGE